MRRIGLEENRTLARSRFIVPLVFCGTLLQAATFEVTDENSLVTALQSVQASGNPLDMIQFSPNLSITLTSPLPALVNLPLFADINTPFNKIVQVLGASSTVNGNGLYSGFFVGTMNDSSGSMTVSFYNLTITNCLCTGGAGGSVNQGGAGGGGLGAGAGIFVDSGATVFLDTVIIQNCVATGGAGGNINVGSGVAGNGGGGGGGYGGGAGGSILANFSFVGGGGGGGFRSSGGAGANGGGGGGGGWIVGGATPYGAGGASDGSNYDGGGGGGSGAGNGGVGSSGTGGTGGVSFYGLPPDGPSPGVGGSNSPNNGGPGSNGSGGGGAGSNGSDPDASGGNGFSSGDTVGGGGGGGGSYGGGMTSNGGTGAKFGGGGGTSEENTSVTGGTGGAFGGGGGSSVGSGPINVGGAGGYGGGGGGSGGSAGGMTNGGAGGFGGGGGGGAQSSIAAPGGYGGGAGGFEADSTGYAAGGGGAGLGGGIYVRGNGLLQIINSCSVAGNSANAGLAGIGQGNGTLPQNGTAAGNGLFLETGSLSVAASGILTLSDSIAIPPDVPFSVTGPGTLALIDNGSINASTPLQILGGIFDISGLDAPVSLSTLSGTSGEIVLGSNNLFITQTASETFGGSIGAVADEGGFTLAAGSTGTLTLTGSNGFTGGLTIDAGTLALSGSGSIASTNNVAVDVDGVFDISGLSTGGSQTIGNLTGSGQTNVGANKLIVALGSSVEYDGQLTGSGGTVEVTGGHTLTLGYTGSDDFTGTLEIGGGSTCALTASASLSQNTNISIDTNSTFDISGSGASQTIGNLSDASVSPTGSSVNLGANTLTVTQGTSETFSGAINGTAGGFTLAAGSTGTLTLTGSNGFTGGLTIDAGTLALSGSGSIASTNNVAVDVDGVFDISGLSTGGSQTIGNLTGSGQTNVGANKLIVALGSSVEYDGQLTGSGGTVEVTGGHTLTLGYTGSDDFTGTLEIGGGSTCALTASASLSQNTNISIDTNSTFDISGSGASQTIGNLSDASVSPTGSSVNLGANTLTVTQGTSETFSGAINGTAGGFTLSGSSQLLLNGSSSNFTGGVVVEGGTLAIGNGGSIPSSNTLTLTGGAFDISMASSPVSLNTLSGTGGQITLGSNSLSIKQMTSKTFGGNIGAMSDDGGFTLAAGSTGTLTLTGSNGFTGGLTIDAGTLALSGSGSIASTNNVAVDVDGVFDISGLSTGGSQTIGNLTGSGQTNVGANKLIVALGSSVEYDGQLTGSGGTVEVTGGHTLTLGYTGSDDFTGTLEIGGGSTCALTASASLSQNTNISIDTNSTFDISGSGASQTIGNLSDASVSPTGSSVNLGANTLTVTQGTSETFSGAINGTAGGFTLSGSSQLLLNGSSSNFTGGVVVEGGTLAIGNGGSIPSSNTLTLTGGAFDISMASSPVSLNTLSGTGGQITLGSNSLSIKQMTSKTFGGNIGAMSDDGGFTLAAGSTGTLTLTGSNGFTGGLTIDAGTLALSGSGSIASTNSVAINSGGTFDISAAAEAIAVGAVSGSGTLALGSTDLTVTISETTNCAATFTGSGGLAKEGAGTWVYSGNSSDYTGNMTVSAGELNLSSNTLGGSMEILLGAVLSGNGMVSDVTCNGTLSPGNSIGAIMIAGPLILTNTSTLDIEIQSLLFDQVNVDDVATLQDGTLSLTFLPGVYPSNASYTILTATGGVSGTFQDNPILINPPGDITIEYPGSSVVVALGASSSLFSGLVFNNPNAQAVANTLILLNTSGALAADPDLLAVVMSLAGQSKAVVENALNQMQPAQLSAWNEVGAQMGRILASLFQHKEEPCCDRRTILCGEQYDWWISPEAFLFTQKPIGYQTGFSSAAVGAVSGLEMSLTTDWALGLAGAYNSTWVGWKDNAGQSHANAWYGGIYAHRTSQDGYFGVCALYGKDFYRNARHLDFTTIDRFANSQSQASEFIAQARGALFVNTLVEISPYAEMTFTSLFQEGFTEHGAQSLDLDLGATQSKTWWNQLGVVIKKSFSFGKEGCWEPNLDVSWLGEWPLARSSYRSRFVGQTLSTTTFGYDATQNFLLLEAGCKIISRPGRSFFIDYAFQYGSHFVGQSFSCDFDLAF